MSLIIFLTGVFILAAGTFALLGFVEATPHEREVADLYGMIFVLTGGGVAMIGLLGMLP